MGSKARKKQWSSLCFHVKYLCNRWYGTKGGKTQSHGSRKLIMDLLGSLCGWIVGILLLELLKSSKVEDLQETISKEALELLIQIKDFLYKNRPT